MAKLKKRKERVKLNEVLNRHLDEMEDTSSIDVFTPKKDANLEMIEMVNEALVEEKNGGKRKGKDDSNISTGIVIGITALVLLFFFFVYMMWSFIT